MDDRLRRAKPPASIMNGGRVAKRLLAVVLALSTLVTLGLYYNGLSGGARMMDDRPQPAALQRHGDAQWSRRAAADDDGLANEVDPAEAKKPRRPAAPVMTATVDRDTCPALGLANTTVDTVSQFSRFEFQVSVAPAPSLAAVCARLVDFIVFEPRPRAPAGSVSDGFFFFVQLPRVSRFSVDLFGLSSITRCSESKG